MKRILALILSLTMLVVILLIAGCGDTNTDNTTPKSTDPAVTTGTNDGPSSEVTTGGDQPEATTTAGSDASTTEPAGHVTPELDGYEKLPGYEDVDFRGATFVIAAYNGASDGWSCDKEIYSEDTDAVSVAVRARNKIMETNYNCTIELQSVEDPGQLAIADVTGNTHNIDMYACKYNFGSAPNKYNLAAFDIDFKNDWWDQEWYNAYAVKDANGTLKMFDVIGDFSLSAFRAIYVLIYNRTLYESSGIEENIYDLVREKKWTMDVFAEMVKKGAKENSGNSDFHHGEGDILGWIRTGHATHALHVASGLKIIDTVNGERTFVMNNHTAEWSDTIDKAIEIWSMPEGETISYSTAHDACRNNGMLFYSEVLGTLEVVKDADLSLGLVPYPLYSESQENYAHYVDNHAMRYAVPLSVPDTDMIADFLELFAYHSKYIVRPAWIDTYSYEYCNDSDSGEMLNIILDTRTYDPAYLSYNKEGEVSSMIDTKKNTVAKWIDRYDDQIINDIRSTVDYLVAYGN